MLKNGFWTKYAFPVGYYYNGNYNTSCTSLKDPLPGHPIVKDDWRKLKQRDIGAFNSCEDMTFWEIYGSDEKILKDKHVIISCDAGRKHWNVVMCMVTVHLPKYSS